MKTKQSRVLGQETRQPSASVMKDKELSETHFQSILDNINELICRFLPDGTLTYVNDAYCRYYGKSRQELIGTNFISTAADDFPQKLSSYFKAFTPDHSTSRFEQYDFLLNGEKRWREWEDRAIFDEQGHLIEFQASGRDITRRKRAEEALQRRASEFAALYEIASEIAGQNDLSELLQTITVRVAKLLNATSGGIYLYDEKQDQLQVVASTDIVIPIGATLHLGEGMAGRVAESREPMIIEDYSHWGHRAAQYDDLPFKAVVEVPMLYGGALIGVLAAYNIGDVTTVFTEEDARLLSLLASLVAGLVKNARDVSERIRAEENLRASEERYHTLYDLMEEGVAINEAIYDEDGNVVDYMVLDANPAFETQSSNTIQSVIGKRATDLYQIRSDSIRNWWLERKLSNHSVQTEFYHEPSGRWFLINTTPIRDNRFATIFTNITERKQAEDALRDREAQLSGLVQSTMDALIGIDEDSRILLFNTAAERLFRCSASDAIGSTLERFIPESARTQHRGYVHGFSNSQQTQRSMRTPSLELNCVRADGTSFSSEISISQFVSNGQKRFIASVRDITERKQAEHQIKRRVVELEALYQSGIAFSQTFDHKEIGDKLIEVLGANLDWHHAVVWIRSDGSDKLKLLAYSKTGEDNKEGEHIQSAITHLGQGIAGWVIEHGTLLNIGNLAEDLRHVEIHQGMRSGLYAPMQVHDTTIGCISVESEQENAFTEADERFLSTLAAQAAVAIETAHSFEKALSTAQRRSVLYDAGQQIVRVTQYGEELYTAVHEAVSKLMPAEAFTIVLYHEENELEGVYLFDKGGRSKPQRIPFGQGFSSQVIRSGNALLVHDLQSTVMERVHFGTDESTRSILAVPLRSGNRVIGAISAQSYLPNAYTEEDRYLLEMLAVQVSIALENARLVQNLQLELNERKRAEEKNQRQLERLNALHEVDHAIASTFDMKVSLNFVLSQACKYLHVDAAAVQLVDPVLNVLEFAAGRGFYTTLPQSARTKVGESYAGKAVLERGLLQIPNIADEPVNLFRTGFIEAEGFVSYFVSPLIVKGKVVGVLEVFDRSLVQRDQEWLDFFSTLAEQTAIAVDNANLFAISQRELMERKMAEEALRQSHAELEQRVADRTAELSRANYELERALRIKDEFLANMSHELRTPLNAILGLSESLSEQIAGELNEKQQSYMHSINESGHHLLDLINDILDLAKIESGQITLNHSRVNIDALCQASVHMVKQMALKRNQEITVDVDTTIGLIRADERRLKQMIVNLLSNAIKFTPQGGQLGLEVHGNQDENTVRITVWDHGIGISDEDLKRLFRPFVQLDSDLARQTSGTGLGLVLVAEMARLHGGSVSVTSQVGVGSRFIITIPWESALSSDTLSKITGKFGIVKPVDGNHRRTILLVEDTEHVIMLLKDYLEYVGYKVSAARNGIDGIEQAKQLHPDLILMDVQMPGMDGLEATQKLKREAEFRNTPIIALTALAMPNDRERCLSAGMDEYMSKPVDLKALVKMIQRFVS